MPQLPAGSPAAGGGQQVQWVPLPRALSGPMVPANPAAFRTGIPDAAQQARIHPPSAATWESMPAGRGTIEAAMPFSMVIVPTRMAQGLGRSRALLALRRCACHEHAVVIVRAALQAAMQVQQQQAQQLQQQEGGARFWPSPRGWVDSRLLTRLHRGGQDPAMHQQQQQQQQPRQQRQRVGSSHAQAPQPPAEARGQQQQVGGGGNASEEVPHNLVEALEASWMGPGMPPTAAQPASAPSPSAAALAGQPRTMLMLLGTAQPSMALPKLEQQRPCRVV